MKFHSGVSISVREQNTIFNSVITLENTICKPRSAYEDESSDLDSFVLISYKSYMVIKHTYVFIIHLKSRLTKAKNFDYFFPRIITTRRLITYKADYKNDRATMKNIFSVLNTFHN